MGGEGNACVNRKRASRLRKDRDLQQRLRSVGVKRATAMTWPSSSNPVAAPTGPEGRRQSDEALNGPCAAIDGEALARSQEQM